MPSSAEAKLTPFTVSLGKGENLTGILRRSPRAKRVRLIVDGRGLTVTAPRRFRQKDLPPLLETYREWIQRSLERIKPLPPVVMPAVVSLPALGETWRVQLTPRGEEPPRAWAKDGVIGLPQDGALPALRRWLHRRAKEALPPLLLELAAEQGLEVGRVFVKNQRSRLGSCSTKRNINLNMRLLFLPPGLVRHVMLHELCHLVEMNHGAAFHRHLLAMDPEAERHRAELRAAWQNIPAWAFQEKTG